jgi:hypothetical protein
MGNYSQEIKELKSCFDNLQFANAELHARLQTLTSLVLGVYKDTLTEGQYKNLYTNYVTVLEENFSTVLNGLEDTLFDQSAFLIRRRFDLFEAIENLKKDDNYILTTSSNSQ